VDGRTKSEVDDQVVAEQGSHPMKGGCLVQEKKRRPWNWEKDRLGEICDGKAKEHGMNTETGKGRKNAKGRVDPRNR